MRWLRSFDPQLPREVWLLQLGGVMNSFGNGLVLPFLVIYLQDVRGFGLGVSGPQVSEGWYGVPFAKPLARTREYIGILRDIWARKGPLESDGAHYPLPRPDGTGLGTGR